MPSSGVVLGAYASSGPWRGESGALAHLSSRQDVLGQPLGIVHHFYAWQDRFPTGLEAADVAAGALPLVTWEPHDADLDDIADGDWDATVRARARDLTAFERPVLLRFAHEMNGDWYSWSGAHQGREAAAARYVRAWRRVHDVVRAEGAVNVVWVWAPNHESVPDERWNAVERYYPGDDYVDWVGVDGYTGRDDGRGFASFETLFGDVYDRYADRKPVAVTEIGAGTGGPDDADSDGDAAKAAWVDRVRRDVRRFPAVVAVVWFDQKKEEAWQLDSGPASLAAFRRLAADPYWRAAPVRSSSRPSPVGQAAVPEAGLP